jgi:hypothetical protein
MAGDELLSCLPSLLRCQVIIISQKHLNEVRGNKAAKKWPVCARLHIKEEERADSALYLLHVNFGLAPSVALLSV